VVKRQDGEGLDWSDRAGMVAQEESAMKAIRDHARNADLRAEFASDAIRKKAAEEQARRDNDPGSGGRGRGGRTR